MVFQSMHPVDHWHGEKSYLSTNLETLFAHLIEKKRADFVEEVLLKYEQIEAEHGLLLQAVPDASRFPAANRLPRRGVCRVR